MDERSGDVLVTTEHGTYRGRRLVVAAGAWTPRLLPQLQVYVVEALSAMVNFIVHCVCKIFLVCCCV